MERVKERIEEFMSIPVQQVHRLIEYRQLRGFRYNMTAADHSAIMTELYTECGTAIKAGIPALLYIGLEDGTFYYMDGDLIVSEYREPGESGYKISDALNPLNRNYKHVNSCVNGTTGEAVQCILQEKAKYIECVNDCEIVPCAIDDSVLSDKISVNDL